jgi:hypothetical protein
VVSRALARVLAVAVAGCAFPGAEQVTSSTIDATSFMNRCSIREECISVHSGELCVPCVGCPNAAIAKSALESYNLSLSAARARCTNLDRNVACAAAACLPPEVACEQGRCVVAR